MGWRSSSLPAVLLITLAVAPVPGHAGDARGAGANTTSSLDVPKGATVGRRSKSEEPAELSAENVALVSEYLKCRDSDEKATTAAKAAWAAFYPACDATIRRFAGKFRARGVDVDECGQQVWLGLLRSLPNFQIEQTRGRFSSWLYTVVRSKAMDMIRQQSRRPAERLDDEPIVGREADPASAIMRKADREQVREAMARLAAIASEKSYRVLELRYFEGWDVKRVADELGLSSEQVWVREHRMKKKLRELMEGSGKGAARDETAARRIA